MRTDEPLDAAMARLQGLLDHGPSPTQPADAWLTAALLEAAGQPEGPDDQELATYAEGGLSDQRRAAVELVLLADPELRTSYLVFTEALAALADGEETAPEPARPTLRVVEGGGQRPRRGARPQTRTMVLAVAAVLVLGLIWQLRPAATPPIDARLLMDSDAPTVRGVTALPAGLDALQIVARVPDPSWWAVVAARPGTATRGPRLDVVRAPEKAADSPHFERNHVLYEDAVPAEAGELAYFIVVSEAPPDALDRVVNDSLVRMGDRDDSAAGFARAMHSEFSAAAKAQGWRVSKTVHVSIRGL